MPGVIPHKGRRLRRKTPGYLSDYALAMYDMDTIRNKLGITVHHFRSACSCFDYVLTANDPIERKRSEQHKWQRAVYEDVHPTYRSAWREIHVTQTDEVTERDKKNGSHPDAWVMFPEERARLMAGQGPSLCGNRAPCVFVPVVDIFDIVKELKPMLPRSCSHSRASEYRDYAELSVLPGKMLVEAARGMLPAHMTAEDTLIVHLRYEMGEYRREYRLCQSDKAVCWGRNGEYNMVDIVEFGRLVKQQAKEHNCTHVFPILPRQFMWDNLVTALIAQFGLKLEDMVSARDLLRVNVMLFERTLAVICQGFVAETKKTSFAGTIANQRRALELSPVVPIEDVLAASSMNITYLKSKHQTDFDAIFKEISEAAQKARFKS